MSAGKNIVQTAMSHYGGRPAPPAAGRPKGRGAPEYAGLKVLGWLHIISGFICFGIGFLWIIAILLAALIGGIGAAREDPSIGGGVIALGEIVSVVVAVAIFLGGIGQIGFGQLLLAVRDMARNSFWLRTLASQRER